MRAAKPLLVANWKSHGSLKENRIWAENFLMQPLSAEIQWIICPPFPHIQQMLELCAGTAVAVGAQNVGAYGAGAYTGEVAAPMLRDLGCRYVIIGHSERRSLYGEDDRQLRLKLRRAIECDLTPIFCIGETLEQRQRSQTQAVLMRQLSAVVDILQCVSLVIAYEPIWAIGTGHTATPAQVQQTHSFVREYWAERGGELGAEVRVIYGGSVKPDNAKMLFAEREIDGALVGSASRQAANFLKIGNQFFKEI